MIGFTFLFLTFIVLVIWFLEDTKVGGKIANWLLRKFDNSGWHYED